MRVLRLASVYELPQGGDLTAVGSDPVGGMQFHTAQLTRALDALGHRQVVVTAHRPGAPRVEQVGASVVVLRLGWGRVSRARQLYALDAAPVLPRIARGAQIVHAHVGEDLAVLPLAELAARSARRPLVVTVHCSLRHTLLGDDLRARVLRGFGGALEAGASRRAAAVITLTDRTRELLVADGVAPDRVHVLPSGFDPARFVSDGGDPFPDIGRPRVGFVGRLAAQKGLPTLLRALPSLRARPAVVIVGDGPLRHRLEEQAGELGLDDRVRFTGFVPHEVVPSVLRHLDLLVLPSEYEELGSVLVEAQAAGVPVVASNVGGIPEVIETDVNGILVPPGDPESLAAAVDRILADPRLAARLRAGALRVAEGRSWPGLADRTAAIYREVTARRGADH